MTLKRILISIIATCTLAVGCYIFNKYYHRFNKIQQANKIVEQLDAKDNLQNGDIIFQTSLSSQSKAIQLATHSPYSHCGIVCWESGKCYVREAHNGIEATSIEKFIARGSGGHFVVKRLKDASVLKSDAATKKMNDAYYSYVNRPYDLYFDWSDDKMYCSELVWKIYKQATGLEVGKLEKLKDFDLNNPVVKQKIKERYGSSIPLNENVISPSDIFNSDLLVVVTEH